MAAIIRNLSAKGVIVSAITPPAVLNEWWGALGQTGLYSVESGSITGPNLFFYRRQVTRAGGNGAVLTDEADTNTSVPSFTWSPSVDSDPPTLVLDDGPTGRWIIDTTDVTNSGGTITIDGPGSEVITMAIVYDTTPFQFVSSWAQSGQA